MGMFDTVRIGTGNSGEYLSNLEGQEFQVKDLGAPIMREFLIENDMIFYITRDHRRFHYDHLTDSITLNFAHIEPDPGAGYLHVHFRNGVVVGEYKGESAMYPVPQYEREDIDARFDLSRDFLDGFFNRIRTNMKAIPIYKRFGMAIMEVAETVMKNIKNLFVDTFKGVSRTIQRYFP